MASFRSIIGVQPSTASTSDSVLVIIDAQNEYAKGKLRLSGLESSRPVIASLLSKYRAAGAPVIHVVHSTPAGAPVFTPGTDLAEEFDELKPQAGESVVPKQHPGSFTGTNLQELLEATGRKKVVLTGYMVSSFSSTCRLFHLLLFLPLLQPNTWPVCTLVLTRHRPTCASPPRLDRVPKGDGMC